MKKHGVLNRELAHVIACMGHTDLLVLCDAGYPVPLGVQCIDLSITMDQPRLLDVINAITQELAVEKVIMENETMQYSPELGNGVRGMFSGVPLEEIPHVDFKELSRKARAVVRTGECTPYANVMLVGGVAY